MREAVADPNKREAVKKVVEAALAPLPVNYVDMCHQAFPVKMAEWGAKLKKEFPDLAALAADEKGPGSAATVRPMTTDETEHRAVAEVALPEIHAPPLAVRRNAHPDWKPLGLGTKEFAEIQQSCTPYPADRVSLCWWQERDSWDWAVRNREKFPTDKFPEAHAKRLQCWEAAYSGPALRFTAYKNCMIAKN